MWYLIPIDHGGYANMISIAIYELEGKPQLSSTHKRL